MKLKYRRGVAALVSFIVILAVVITQSDYGPVGPVDSPQASVDSSEERAETVLERLEIKGRSPLTDYSRDQFGDGWRTENGCDTRNIILARDLVDEMMNERCQVVSGQLSDPYTGRVITFRRGADSSDAIQIDHVVALSDAWQSGAWRLSIDQRIQLANDPLELLAVDGPANQQKGGANAASWLPANKAFRCSYVARQIAVKDKYGLSVTSAERDAMLRVLNRCPDQRLPSP